MRVFDLHMQAPLALFAGPWTKSDPYSEPVPPPATIAGLLRSLYWKPQWEWFVDQVRVRRPIVHQPHKRSGIQDHIGIRTPMMQHQTLLTDVDYIIRAHIVRNPSAHQDPARNRSLYEHEKIVERYLKRGSVFGAPHAGRTEFACDLTYLPEGYAAAGLADTINLDLDLGPVCVSWYPENPARNQWRPHFRRLRMVGGVVTVPADAYPPDLLAALDRSAGEVVARARKRREIQAARQAAKGAK